MTQNHASSRPWIRKSYIRTRSPLESHITFDTSSPCLYLMSTRRWLDIITSQLEQLDQRLADGADPIELTVDGEVAYGYLVQAREALHRGSMVLEEGVRRALGLFTGEHGRAYRRRLRGLNYPDVDPNSHQEVAGNNRVPSGPPTASSSEAGGSRPHNLGYVYCLLTRGMTLIGN